MAAKPGSARLMSTKRQRLNGVRALRRLWAGLGIPADVAARATGRIQRVPRKLSLIGHARDDGRALRLAPAAARAWRRMEAAAAADGITLLPLSAYRSVARQAFLIRRKLTRGVPIGAILRLSAVPGCSEHHTGRALDLGTPGHLALEPSFARTAAFRWLRRHAGKFGFKLSYPRHNPKGIAYEPWHWCWQPTSRAAAVKRASRTSIAA
jgi:D-alanyl-D-alanine carboxypeptidase